jgi:hypothetical protein
MAYLGSSPSFNTELLVSNYKPKDADRFSGDSSNTSFTLSRSVEYPVDIEVFVENVQQEPVVSYTVTGKTLQFSEAPPTGTNNIYVVYKSFGVEATISVPSGSISSDKLANNIKLFTTDNFTANGSGNTFVLSETPADANTVMVSIDGIVQRSPINYNVTNDVITFTSNPPASSNVSVRHLGFRTATTLTAIPANTTIPQANLVNPTVVGTITGGNVSATAISTELMTTTGNLDFRVGTSQNTAFRIESTGQLWNTYESDVGTDYRTTLHRGYMARAWVNFDGTGSVAIRASGNVSSITDNGTGDYTVNFTTAMPDANYSALATANQGDSARAFMHTEIYTTSSLQLRSRRGDTGNYVDKSIISTAIFR